MDEAATVNEAAQVMRTTMATLYAMRAMLTAMASEAERQRPGALASLAADAKALAHDVMQDDPFTDRVLEIITHIERQAAARPG